MIILAIDPGTGISSPTGIAIFDSETKTIIHTENLSTKRKILQHRIKDISDQLEALIASIGEAEELTVAIESFVMRGKGGETLQRLIGSFMGRLPYRVELLPIQNTTVKLIVGGHGHAEKHEMAARLPKYFNESSHALIKALTQANEYDILDALAIGAAAWSTKLGEVTPRRKGIPKKRPKKS